MRKTIATVIWRGVHVYRRCSVCGRMLDDDGEHAETPPATRR